MVKENHVYKMTIDFHVLDLLGINLYSNVAAILTEAVANAWDADSTIIQIFFDKDNNKITIKDDGIGMTILDMNDKYLKVGYRRRDVGSTLTDKGRIVMGRKGLGKLSFFSIANTVTVQSVKDNEQHGLRMTVDGIRKAMNKIPQEYYPEVLNNKELEVKEGTIIYLTDLKMNRLGITADALRRRLARRFSIIGSKDFQVFIDEEEVTVKDRGDLEVVQFLWNLDKNTDYSNNCPNLKECELINNMIVHDQDDRVVKGWIGTVGKPKQLVTSAGNLNSIVVHARGRLIMENILDKINDGRLYTKYVTGHIEADFLDKDELEDIVTSDRQRIQENDDRYDFLISTLKNCLNHIESKWSEWRKKYGAEELIEENPVLMDWLKTLPDGFRKHARDVIGVVSEFPEENISGRKELLRYAVFAFERLKLKGAADALANALESGVDAVIKLLADQDILESSLYRDIVISRLESIKAFRNLVDDDAKEKVLQEYLFNDLWLLDPSWERATGSEIIEARLKIEGIIIDDLTEKEKLGRVDIAYRTTAGKHVIVELKRAGRQMKLIDLVEQGQRYTDALRKILISQRERNPNIEVVFVIGKPLEEEESNPDRLKSMMDSISPGSRVIHYDFLIKSAIESYKLYLDANAEADKIGKIAERL